MVYTLFSCKSECMRHVDSTLNNIGEA